MEPTSNRLRWIMIVVACVGVLAGGGIFVWTKVRDLSTYHAAIVDQVRKVTGRELTASRPLHIALSWRPTAIAEGITLSNAKWGSRPEMIRIRRISMQLDLMTLLLGGLKIGKVTIEGADLLVESNPTGESNLEMAPPPDGSGPHAKEHRSLRLRSGPTLPWVTGIEIVNSVITVAGFEGRTPITLAIDKADLLASSGTAPLQGDVAGRIDSGAAISLKGSFGSFEGWLKGLPGKIDARGVLGGGTLAIEGNVAQKGIAIGLKADGPDISALSGFARIALPAYGPFLVEAKLANQRNGYKIDFPTLRLGDGQFTGEISFRTDRFGRKIAAATFEAPHLDLASLQRPIAQAQAPVALPQAPPSGAMAATPQAPAAVPGTPPRRTAAPAVDSRLLSTDPLPVDLLKSWNATLSVKLGEIIGGPVKITSAALNIGLSGGRFTFRPAATFGSGSFGFDFSYDVSGKVPTGALTATLSHVSLEEFLLLFGTTGVVKDGMGDLDLRMRGTGRSIRELVTSAQGSMSLSLGSGRLMRDSAQFIAGDWRRLVAGASGDVAWNCADIRGDIKAGTFQVPRLVVDLPKIIAVGGGYVHSRSETMEILIAPEPREAALIAASVPLRVKGSASGLVSEPDSAIAKTFHQYWPPTTPAPSLVGQMAKTARSTPAGGNSCSVFANQVTMLRPYMPTVVPKPPVAASPDRGRKR